MATEQFTCIECGHPVRELYQRYQGDVIKVVHCDKCGHVADRYIEYDSVLILLDALLHKPQAYRHVLLNTKIQWEWKLLVVLLLCSTFEKWETPREVVGEDSTGQLLLSAAMEWRFYQLFLISLAEWAILCVCVLVLTRLSQYLKNGNDLTNRQLLGGIVLSSFGRLFIIPAILWGQTHSATYLLLSEIFVLTSNIAAIKVLCDLRRLEALMIVIVAHAAKWSSTYLFVV